MGLAAIELSKIYDKRQVVAGVSLAVDQGQVIGLLGPNGAGKTTTFYMIIGFLAVEKGNVLLEGREITRLPFYQRARLGIVYLPQEPSIFPRLRVEENLDLVLEWAASPEKRKSIREGLLVEFGLRKLRRQRAGTLSAGERRQVEIARSLATSPSYILLDEPFSGIDPLTVANLQDQIVALKRHKIGLIVTDHNVHETLSITDYAYLIDQGKIITAGPPQEIIADPLARRLYLGEGFKY
ncbi:MAG: LPS export ABC transporter ATP-binding protein [Candidatus Bipolaricaulota bacterium]|nr:LPS export ABC transporter ATP-binding protein [Candidatus Bipolaricaulota bacterium]